jgi:hypothetical protein
MTQLVQNPPARKLVLLLFLVGILAYLGTATPARACSIDPCVDKCNLALDSCLDKCGTNETCINTCNTVFEACDEKCICACSPKTCAMPSIGNWEAPAAR